MSLAPTLLARIILEKHANESRDSCTYALIANCCCCRHVIREPGTMAREGLVRVYNTTTPLSCRCRPLSCYMGTGHDGARGFDTRLLSFVSNWFSVSHKTSD